MCKFLKEKLFWSKDVDPCPLHPSLWSMYGDQQYSSSEFLHLMKMSYCVLNGIYQTYCYYFQLNEYNGKIEGPVGGREKENLGLFHVARPKP